VADVPLHLQTSLAERYTIEREIGHGGAALVYLARDLKLGRPVAIKVLRHEIAAAVGAERFLREIEIAARLMHPHILALHDSGEANGFLYYVMPFVEGESLRDRLNHEPQLPLAETLRISRAVAEALTYAHSHGVVHRDVKPENILLFDAAVLVADFGIARAITAAGGESLTETGIAVGTPFYMSPEQAAGERQIDGRSDVYSLGCVVYEMLAGGPPFTGPSAQAIVARHALDPVPPLRTIRPELPAAVDQALGKALSKAPADRFPTVTAFLEALTHPAGPRGGRQPRARAALLVAGTVAALVAGYALILRRPASPDAGTGTAERSIVVLPFRNIGGDSGNDYFSEGMSEELITALSKVPELSVAAPPQRLSRQFRIGEVDARGLGSRLAVAYLIDGSVRKVGHRLRVSAQLISAADGHVTWSDEYERDDQDVFAVEDELSTAIVRALQVRLTGAATIPSARRLTDNLEAYDLYLQGRYFYEKRNEASLRKAQEYFERAIQKDSSYALAYSGLSDTYSFLSVFGYAAPRYVFPQAKAAALRALQLGSTLAEAHTSLGFIAVFYDRDWPAARQHFDRALVLDPRYAPAHLFHEHYFVAVGNIDEAIREGRRAVELDPFSLINNTRLATMLFWARRYTEALAQARHTLDLDSTYTQARLEAARAYLMLGRCAEALAQIEHGPASPAGYGSGTLGFAYAKCGRRAQALAELAHLHAKADSGRYVTHYGLAMIHAGLGDPDRAFAELDSAYVERAWPMFLLKVEPAFDDLRADPRFARLLKKVGLPP
jgi:eukaryotic-like serine/threonine-protein kinase